jgi:hypothetical protein
MENKIIGILQPTVSTPCDSLTFTEAAVESLFKANAVAPSKATTMLVVAKTKLETGVDLKNCFNFNISNTKYLRYTPTGRYHFLQNVWEIENNKRVTYQPPHPQCAFKSYASFSEGIDNYFSLLKNNKSYHAAWAALNEGKAYEYIAGLKAGNYFTASFVDYYSGVNRIWKDLMRTDLYEAVMGFTDLEEL